MIYIFMGLIIAGLWLVFNNIISFAMLLLLLLVLTGIISLIDFLFLKKKRPAGAIEPTTVEYAKSFFPVILVVFLIRSFVVEPFKIPSGSMIPTLQIGDFILVNKYAYGLRVPIVNNTFIEVGHPQRGEVMVFHYPADPMTDFIKRVVGLPGDRLEYRNKLLTINGVAVPTELTGSYEYMKSGLNYVQADLHQETLGTHKHAALTIPQAPTLTLEQVRDFPNHENCNYDKDGFVCTVPAGNYFMMGDNRDDSNDSRYWGFVPEQNVVGKAFFIWMSFDHLGRVGTKVE